MPEPSGCRLNALQHCEAPKDPVAFQPSSAALSEIANLSAGRQEWVEVGGVLLVFVFKGGGSLLTQNKG